MTLSELLSKMKSTRWPTDSLPAVPPGGTEGPTANEEWQNLTYDRTGSPEAAFAAAFIPEIASALVPTSFGSKIPVEYANATMRMRPTTVNVEATAPELLQKAAETLKGRALSDARYAMAKAGAKAKGMKMANAPAKKAQGVWVDPPSNTYEFNTVYSQDVGRLPEGSIGDSEELYKYATSMGGDLGQWGVGANRFSPIPFNVGKKKAGAVRYGDATDAMIREAGSKVNPLGGVVAADPRGGMVVFPVPGANVSAQDLAGMIGGRPRYGMIDATMFETNAAPQGKYMTTIDDLIRRSGY